MAVNYNKDSQFYKTIKPKFDSYKKNNEFSADVPESVKKIDEAFFFEENKAYTDAIRCYEEAISLEPDATPFKIAYNEFFNRLYSMDESSNKK